MRRLAPTLAAITALSSTLSFTRNANAERLRPWQAGFGLSAFSSLGDDESGAGLALFAAYVHSNDREGDATRLFLALGANATIGKMEEDDRSASHFALGPEARVGLGFGVPTELVSLYLSASPLFVRSSERAPWATESGGAFGLRAVLGVSLLDSWPYIAWIEQATEKRECDGPVCAWEVVAFLLPNTLELGYERVRDSHRAVMFLGYTF